MIDHMTRAMTLYTPPTPSSGHSVAEAESDPRRIDIDPNNPNRPMGATL